MPGVRIAPAEDPVACSAVEDLQREVWGLPDRGIVPGEQVRAIVHNGGMLLLAHAGDELVGFCFAFVGLDGDRPIWCSHMLAVRPQWRSRGIGRALKLAQRDLARDRGIDLITWTFDPLQARNAHLNLHRLGARARRYLVDHYGTMDDAINRGMPSDRLVAEWEVAGDAVRTTATAPAGPATGTTAPPPTRGDLWILPPAGGAGPPRPGAVRDTIPASGGLIAVPTDIAALGDGAPGLVAAWRLALRPALQRAFAGGLVAVDLRRDAGPGVCAYVLKPGA